VLAVGSVVAAVGLTVSLQRISETRLGDHPGARDATDLVLDALPPAGEDAPPVLLDIRDVDVWTTATAVALEMEEAGYRISVEQTWVYGFGTDRETTGNEDWEVAIQPVEPGQPPVAGQVGVVQGQSGPQAIVVERIR
jgi:hypothetical protein